MADQNHNQLSEVLQKVNELAQKAARGDYLYRGEPRRYREVSSGLYRKYQKVKAAMFDIAVVQDEMLQEAKRFIGETDEDAILEQLQHFGYPTNQIDFTTDHNIALFFACYSELEKDGRVILLDKAGRDDLRQPKAPENRVTAQKSVFVRPPQGFVKPSNTIVIPKGLKRPILQYLDKSHSVNAAALFNDIHGFIRYHSVHESAYAEFYAGLTHYSTGEYNKAMERFSRVIELNPQLSVAYNNRGSAYAKKGEYDRAIQDYDRAIELDPSDADAYYNRGLAYMYTGDHDRAIRDCNSAIELDPNSPTIHLSRGLSYFLKGDYHSSIQDYSRAIVLDPSDALAYYNRGLSWLCLEEWEKAESDLSQAQSLGRDMAATFCSAIGSVAAFELTHNVKLPVNIAAMLTPKQ